MAVKRCAGKSRGRHPGGCPAWEGWHTGTLGGCPSSLPGPIVRRVDGNDVFPGMVLRGASARPARGRAWAAATLLALVGHALVAQWLSAPADTAAQVPRVVIEVLELPPREAAQPRPSTAAAAAASLAGAERSVLSAGPSPSPGAAHAASPAPAAMAGPANRSLLAAPQAPTPRPGVSAAGDGGGAQRSPADPPPAPREIAAGAALADTASARPTVPAPGALPPPDVAAVLDEPMPPAGAEAAGAPDPEAVRRLPVYPTRLPGPFERRFLARRGAQVGQASLRFEPDGQGGYALSFDMAGDGRPWLQFHSSGQTGGAGLLPGRFVDRRQGRSARSTRFEREAGLVRIGARGIPQPLATAGQDRLSWWVQLPAVLNARPDAPRAGERLSLQVAGVRGDAAIWHFDNQGLETLAGADGVAQPAWHWRREAQSPYDLQVDIWLDPQDNHLPLRAWLTPIPGSGTLALEAIPPAPFAGRHLN